MPGVLDLLAQPKFQFTGRLFSEGYGDDAVETAAAGGDNRDDAADQRRGFAGAGGGFNDKRGIEVVADTFAHTRVGKRRCGDYGCVAGGDRHRIALSRVRPATFACASLPSSLRLTRCSS